MNSLLIQELELGFRNTINAELEPGGLCEVIGWVARDRRSALIRLCGAEPRATLFVRDGQVVRVEYGGRDGDSALLELLCLGAGPCQLLLRAPPNARANVQGATEDLLVRGASMAAKNADPARLQLA